MMEQSEIKNPSAYFHKVLKDDGAGAWMNEQTKKLNKAEKVATEKAKKEQEATEKAKKEKAKTEAKTARIEAIKADFYALSEDEQEAIRSLYGEDVQKKYAESEMWEKGKEANKEKPELHRSVVSHFFNYFDFHRRKTPIPFEFNN